MNLIEHYVTRVLSAPYESYGYWLVRVEANSYGIVQPTVVYLKTLDEAKAVTVGYHFDA